MSYRAIPSPSIALLCASLGAGLPSAWASPTGPQVIQGSASVATAGGVTTVTNTPGTVIQWQSFNLAPGETVRFTESGVVNRVPSASAVGGSIQSPGQFFFMNGSVITAPNVSVDLAGLVNSSLKFDALPASAREAGDADVRGGRLLTGGKMFIIGPELSRFSRPGTGVVLAPGTAGELGDVRVPFVRVHVAASASKPLDVESMIARRPQIGIFNALFLPSETRFGQSGPTAIALAVPAPAPAVMPAAPGTQSFHLAAFTAPVEERSMAFAPIPPAPVEERSFAFVAPAAPVEERVLVAMALIPAPVEDRLVAPAPSAPVEERALAALKLIPAPVEERIAKTVVHPQAPVTLARTEERRLEPTFAPVQVASIGSFPVIVISSPERVAPQIDRAPAPAAVTVSTTPQKRLQFLTDRRGGLFFM
jgi:filamentous hemagglutinin family protein